MIDPDGSISAASLSLIRSTNSSSRRSRPASGQGIRSGPKRSASFCSSGWTECRPQRRHWICPPSRPASRAFSRAASRRRDRLQVFYLHGQELFQLHPPPQPPHLLPAHPALLCLRTHFSIGILPWSFNSLGLPAIFSSTFARSSSDPLIFSQRVRRCGSQVFQTSSPTCFFAMPSDRRPASVTCCSPDSAVKRSSTFCLAHGMHTRPRWLLQFGTAWCTGTGMTSTSLPGAAQVHSTHAACPRASASFANGRRYDIT